MKIRVERDGLADAVAWVARSLPSRPPVPVLGGVLLFMFGMVASVGIDIIGRNMTSRRDAVILAASLAVGLGIQAAPPGAFDAVPQALRILVTDGIVMGILLAMALNLLFPKEER